MTWLGWVGVTWLVLSGIVTGFVIAAREQTPDPLRDPELDDLAPKLKRLATDALLGDAIRPMSCIEPEMSPEAQREAQQAILRALQGPKPRVAFCEEMRDKDRKAPWETEDDTERMY